MVVFTWLHSAIGKTPSLPLVNNYYICRTDAAFCLLALCVGRGEKGFLLPIVAEDDVPRRGAWFNVAEDLDGPLARMPCPRWTCALEWRSRFFRSAVEPVSDRWRPSASSRAELTSPFRHRNVPSWSTRTQPLVSASSCTRVFTSAPLAAAVVSSVRGQMPLMSRRRHAFSSSNYIVHIFNTLGYGLFGGTVIARNMDINVAIFVWLHFGQHFQNVMGFSTAMWFN